MKPWGRIAFWIVVAAQLVFLIGFIVVKEADLRIGTEVVLQPSRWTRGPCCRATTPSLIMRSPGCRRTCNNWR